MTSAFIETAIGAPVSQGRFSTGSTSATLAFIAAFPAFIVYQILVATGTIPPVLGGSGAAGSAIALPFALHAAYRQTSLSGFAPTSVGALSLVYLALLGTVVFFADAAQVDRTVTGSHAAFAFKFVVWYLIARSVNAEAPAFRRTARVLFVAVVALVLGIAISRRSIIPVLHPLVEDTLPGDYQGAGLVFIVLAAYALPAMRLAVRWPAYVLAIAALFLIGARSEFVGLVLMIIVIEWCKARSRPLALLSFAAAGASAALLLGQVEAAASENRIFGLLAIARDQSAILRGEMADAAWQTVWESPVIGAYASYPPGEYAHNIVSAWVDFGIAGFFLLLCLLAVPLAGLATRFGEDGRRDDYVRALAVASVVALVMVLAKMHAYALLAVSLGLYARYRITRQARLLAP